jgi:hypothetical protein
MQTTIASFLPGGIGSDPFWNPLAYRSLACSVWSITGIVLSFADRAAPLHGGA